MTVASQRLYLTADDRVVSHGDPDAAFLLCAAGAEIPDGYSEPKAKAQDKPQDKQAKPSANKSKKDD